MISLETTRLLGSMSLDRLRAVRANHRWRSDPDSQTLFRTTDAEVKNRLRGERNAAMTVDLIAA